MEGRIELILGPMASGKSSQLVARLERARIRHRVALLKARQDSRGDDSIHLHDGRALAAQRFASLAAAAPAAAAAEVIGIDEGQFFPDLAPQCERWKLEGKRVIVTALDSKHDGRRFCAGPRSCDPLDLVPAANEVTKLTAECACGGEAVLTRRRGGGTEDIAPGGLEEYEPQCLRCFRAARGAEGR